MTRTRIAARRATPIALALLAAACTAPPGPAPATTAAPAPPLTAAASPDPAPTGRLGDAVVPTGAALEVRVDPREPTFRGRVAIDLAVSSPAAAIWLNARELTIERAHLVRGPAELALRPVAPAPPGLLGLALPRELGPGPARLVIDYTGKLGARSGLFRQQVEGLWYAFTDFEAADARLAMPSFDEPRFKIPWQITLVHPEGMRAFANMPEARASGAGRGWRRVEFAPTRPLPSYLVAFAVGPFDVLDGPRSPVPLRVIATRGRASLGADALRLAPAMLVELERYLGSRTPFPKVDLVAVPIMAGAMENPGLVTFADPILLLPHTGRSTAAWRDRYRFMAGVLAHEMVHLWFGDLVTMRWWDDLWLNEGVATFLSDRVVVAADPAQAGTVVEVVDKRLGLDLDREPTEIPVRRPVSRVEEIEGLFSPLVYRKGGSILAMFEALIGEERMRSALRAYMVAGTDGTVTTADLAAALSTAAGRDLRPALGHFVDQPGVPLVEAALECGARPKVSLRQRPYTPLGAAPARGRTWSVPVCVELEGVAAPVCTLLEGERAAIELPSGRCPAWVHPNPDERGYYLYALPPAQLRALAARRDLTGRERAGLADDVAALLAAGAVDLAAALDAFESLARARDPLADVRAAEALALVSRALIGPRQQRAFGARVRAAYGARAGQLGVAPREGESGADADLRVALVPLVGRDADDRALQREALRRLRESIDRKGSRPGRDGQTELEIAIRLGPLAADAELFQRLLDDGRGLSARALTGFRQPALVARALEAVDRDRLGPAESLDLLAARVRDGATHDAALPVALRLYPFLAARIADTQRARSAAVLGSACRTEARAPVEDALRQALGRRGALPPAARAAVAQVTACGAFRDRYLREAAALFR